MSEDRRGGGERRQVQRGGRRSTDLRALTPELQVAAGKYAAEIERDVELLKAALADNDIVSARAAIRGLKQSGDALQSLLATGKAVRQR